ncbi:DUF1289 domain-containing protein [Alteromonas stellipolaris]|uniref:DUF1289 domain-containing protein n=1 Tax=Alteromonas stellipolaris TaxID=233316 RepID=UPI000AB87F8A|nr:DUF1289 domain-containing protein [Alteromonas stellipolaris]
MSPCIANCKLDADDVCTGCKRTIKEITSWSSYSTQQKQNVLTRLQTQKLDTHSTQKLK